MKIHDKSYERFMFNQIKTIFCNVLFAHSASASVRFPYFNQSLNFLQRFIVFNILRYQAHLLGLRNLTDWKLHEDLYFRSVIKVHY